jgi:hypothetical protein
MLLINKVRNYAMNCDEHCPLNASIYTGRVGKITNEFNCRFCTYSNIHQYRVVRHNSSYCSEAIKDDTRMHTHVIWTW